MSAPVNTADFMTEFREFHDCFAIIGGTPTVMYLEDRRGASPRATKDLDIVLIDIANDGRWKGFVEKLKAYLVANKYQCRELASGKAQCYRFDRPQVDLAPKIIELSSRREANIPVTQPAQRLDEFDMSAIVCESYFVDLLAKHSIKMAITGGEVPIPKIGLLIAMKAFAVLNLEKSEDPDKRGKVSKHVVDIGRLASVLNDDDVLSLPASAYVHLKTFLDRKRDFFDGARLAACGWTGASAVTNMEALLLKTIIQA